MYEKLYTFRWIILDFAWVQIWIFSSKGPPVSLNIPTPTPVKHRINYWINELIKQWFKSARNGCSDVPWSRQSAQNRRPGLPWCWPSGRRGRSSLARCCHSAPDGRSDAVLCWTGSTLVLELARKIATRRVRSEPQSCVPLHYVPHGSWMDMHRICSLAFLGFS